METLVREKNTAEIKQKLNSIISDFGKVAYLESALTHNFTFDIKRFLYTTLADVCEKKKLYEKAAKAIVNRTTIEVTYRERIASFTKAGELYAKAGKVEESIHTFLKATSEANSIEKQQIKTKVKNILLACAEEAYKSSKRSNAIKYYEKLLEMPMPDAEKQEIKNKLITIYKSLGKFAEVKSLEMGLRGSQTQTRTTREKSAQQQTQPKSNTNEFGIEIM